MHRTWVAVVSALLGACSGPMTAEDASAGGVDSGTLRADASAPRDGAVMMGTDGGDGVDGGPPPGCAYPADPVEPMALGAVIWPYRWPEAVDGAGRNFPLDFTEVHCTEDPNRDWSPFDVLVFISIPGW